MPFYILAETVATGPARNLSGLSLQSLCKAFWLAKSYDWNLAINWSYVTGTQTVSGVMTGSGTVTLDPYKPKQRTVCPIQKSNTNAQFPARSFETTGAVAMVGSTTYAISGGGGGSGSCAVDGGLDWFQALGGSAFMTKDTSGNYLSAANLTFAATVVPAPGFTVDPRNAATSATSTITVDGANATPIPITMQAQDFWSAVTATGHFNINFNQFWTP